MDYSTNIPPIDIDRNYVREIITKMFGELTDEQFKELFTHFEWIQIKAGDQLIKQGETSNHINFLIYGRLTAIKEDEQENFTILGDVFPGQAVGENSVIAERPHAAHIFSARDSILIRLSKKTLYNLGSQFPNLVFNIAKTIIIRAEKNSKRRKLR